MNTVYTIRQFRSHLKEALDKVDTGERVHILRNKKVYLLSNGVHSDNKTDFNFTYGCGCKKTNKLFCDKHGRY